MSSAKQLLYALTLKNEASYGAGGSLSLTTDGVELQDTPAIDLGYAYDGKRPSPGGTFGQIKRNATSGRTAKFQYVVDGKGLGSAYSATATPPSLHASLLASGLSGSFTSPSWSYVPGPVTVTPNSFTADGYLKGEKITMTAGYCSLTIDCPGPEGADFMFDAQALASTPVDAAFPAITYVSSSTLAPKAESIALALGAFSSAKVRSWKFDQKRDLQARVDINSAAGHAGFNAGKREPSFIVVIEAEALATFNPYTAREGATVTAVSVQMGSVANNKFTLSIPQAQLVDVKPGADGNVPTWELTYAATTTTPTANDDFSLSFS